MPLFYPPRRVNSCEIFNHKRNEKTRKSTKVLTQSSQRTRKGFEPRMTQLNFHHNNMTRRRNKNQHCQVFARWKFKIHHSGHRVPLRGTEIFLTDLPPLNDTSANVIKGSQNWFLRKGNQVWADNVTQRNRSSTSCGKRTWNWPKVRPSDQYAGRWGSRIRRTIGGVVNTAA